MKKTFSGLMNKILKATGNCAIVNLTTLAAFRHPSRPIAAFRNPFVTALAALI